MSTGLPTVTALVATYNYAKYLPETLDSALEQDYPPELLDIVVVDDGSQDETPEVVAEYERRHPGRVRGVRQDNQGFVGASNTALAEGLGELLAFLDSDDLWPPDKTRRQAELLRSRPEVGIVYTDTEAIDPYGTLLRPSVWDWYGQTPLRGPDCLLALLEADHGQPALNSTIMVRRSLLERFAPIPEGVPYVDWWVLARVAQVAELDYLEGSRVGYRLHGENITFGAFTGPRAVRETLKAMQMRRKLLAHGAADAITGDDLVKVLQAFEVAGTHAVRLATSVYLPLHEGTPPEPEAAARFREEAVRATIAGDLEEGLRARVMAVMSDPWDDDSRRWVRELTAVREAPEVPDVLADARSFVTVVRLSELRLEHAYLEAYALAFTAEDDASLVVDATDVEPGKAVQELHDIIARLGLAADALPDVLVVTEGGARSRLDLERRADALLTRRPSRLGNRAIGPERVVELRTLAEQRTR